jgi:hypothetical protein
MVGGGGGSVVASSWRTLRATAKAEFEAGTPAYTAVWMNTSAIS